MKKRGHNCSQKRGQLTLFIFMTVVVVVAIVAYSLFDFGVTSSAGVDSEVSEVYDATQFCIEDVSGKALLDVGVSGGYFNLPEMSNDLFMPYYMYEGENLMPSLETIEEELALYVEALATVCTRKAYASMPRYDVAAESMKVTTMVTEDDTVEFVVSYPLSVMKGETVYYIDQEYSVSFPVRLYTMYSVASSIVREHDIEPRALCINCAGDLAYENLVFIDLWDVYPSEVVYYISDGTSYVGNDAFELYFVIKYPEGDYDPFENF